MSTMKNLKFVILSFPISFTRVTRGHTENSSRDISIPRTFTVPMPSAAIGLFLTLSPILNLTSKHCTHVSPKQHQCLMII